jgi:antitoxin component of MazEF toxin-antitoxin module
MQLKIRKWGNSAGLLLSRPLLEQLDTEIGDTVTVEVKNGGLFIKPLKKSPSLRTLLAGSPKKMLEKTREDQGWVQDGARGRELL